MTPAQKKAISEYRKRQKDKGLVRVEVNVPEVDKQLIRRVAESLRSGGPEAEEIRTALNSVLSPFEGLGLKELLEKAPLPDDFGVERTSETWKERDIDW